VAGVLCVSGCVGGDEPPARSAPSSGATAAPAAQRPSCTGEREGTFSVVRNIAGNDGGFLLLGSGQRGVLLVPQSDGDICQWLSTGRRLASAGYHVGLMDWSTPYEDSVTAAAALLRGAGAPDLVLVGASRGGAYVLGLAAGLQPAGVVSFSGEGQLGDWNADERIRSYRGPLLLLGSVDDGFAPEGVTRVLAANHPGSEQVLVVPGHAHGIALLTGPYAAQVTAMFDAFLARVLPR